MEEIERTNIKKDTKQTIGVSLEAYEIVKALTGKDKKFKTIKEAGTDLILSSNLAVKEATIAKDAAEKKVDWIQEDVDRLTDREKMLVEEGRSARDALGQLEDKYSLVKFLLYASWVVFGIGIGLAYVFF